MSKTVEILGQEFTLYRLRGQEGEFVREDCWKCGGSGVLPHFYHVFDGQCFACGGSGGQYLTVERMTKRIKGRQQRAAAKVRLADRKAKKLADDLAEFVIANGDLAFMITDAVHDDEIEMHPILRDMGRRLQQYGSISDKQIAFARRLIEEAQTKQQRREAERAMAKPAPLGRQIVEGQVIKAVDSTTYYGYSEQYNWRITVKTDDGWVANGNLPRSIRDEFPGLSDEIDDLGQWIKGQRVRFTATLELPEPKDGEQPDPTFVFFKRAAKGAIVQEEVVNLEG